MLLGRLQLLVDVPELVVGHERLLVRGAQLLVRGVVFLQQAVEVEAGVVQLPLELRDAAVLLVARRRSRGRLDPGARPGAIPRLRGRREPRVDPLPVARGEPPGRLHGLGGSDHKEAVRLEGVVELGQDVLPGVGLQADEQVPAADEVHPREGGIAGQVVAGEDADVPHGLVHLVLAVQPDEEPPKPLGRDVLHDGVRIRGRPRRPERGVALVGGEHLQVAAHVRLLQQADGDRVGQLAGGAAGHPHADGHVRRLLGE